MKKEQLKELIDKLPDNVDIGMLLTSFDDKERRVISTLEFRNITLEEFDCFIRKFNEEKRYFSI